MPRKLDHADGTIWDERRALVLKYLKTGRYNHRQIARFCGVSSSFVDRVAIQASAASHE